MNTLMKYLQNTRDNIKKSKIMIKNILQIQNHSNKDIMY